MAQLTFESGVSRHRPIKDIPKKYRESQLRPNVFQGDGIAPAFPMIPLRNLDVKFQDVSTEQWVVIPKGRLVSSLTVQNKVAAAPLDLSLPEESGNIATGTESAIDQTPLYVSADGSYYGYSRNIAGLMVPSNGGNDRTITYDADDVEALVPDMVNGGAVSAGDTYVLPANAPVGAAMYDVYQDIRGAHLNYELWKNYGVQAWGIIVIPYVDYGLLETEAGVTNFVNTSSLTGFKVGSARSAFTAADAGYQAVEKWYSFLYFDSEAFPIAGLTGQLLKSDLFGNYIPAGAEGTAGSTTIDLQAARTAQTVGRIVGCDPRHPKDLLEYVDGYDSRVRVTGSKTAGIPAHLYDFTKKLLVAGGFDFSAGSKDEAKHIKDVVQSGAIGYAKIQLSIK